MLLRSQKFTKVTHPRSKAAFGSRRNLIAASQCPSAHKDIYLNSSETYTKFKLTGKRFVRLKVASYRLNEIWSIDLANMQKLAASNNGIRYLFVAVDVLSRYFFLQCNAPTGKICVDKGLEFAGDFVTFCRSKGIDIYSIKSETKSALAERNFRSLKSLIFKYMHEHDRNTHIDYLDQVVSITNRRVNRMTKLAPFSVSKKRCTFSIALSYQCSA